MHKGFSQSDFYQRAWNHYSLLLNICGFLEVVWRLRKTFDQHCKSVSHGLERRAKIQFSLERLGVWSANGQIFLSLPSYMPILCGFSSLTWPPLLLFGTYLHHKWTKFIFSMKNHIIFLFCLIVSFHGSLVPCPNYLCKVTFSVLVC